MQSRHSSIMENKEKEKATESFKWREFVAILGFFWVALCIGLGLGLPAVQIPSIIEKEDKIEMTHSEVSWFSCLSLATCIPGNLIGGFVASQWGRKIGGILVCPFFFAGFLLSAYATNVHGLFAGMASIGFAVGLQHSPCATYYSEVCSPSLRTSANAFSGVWCLSGLMLPTLLKGFGISWRVSSSVFSIVPVIAIVHILLVPESPAWFVTKGKLKEAKRAIVKLRGPRHDSEEELQYLVRSYAFIKDRPFSFVASLERLTDPDVWKPFLIVNIMFVFQMWCGFAFLDRYILVILSASGLSFDRYMVATSVGVAKVLGQVNAGICLLRFGRRPLYIFSSLAVCLASAGMALSSLFHPDASEIYDQDNSTQQSQDITYLARTTSAVFILDSIQVLSLCVITFACSSGIGPIPWAYSCELFPLDLRPQLSGITSSLVQLQNFVMVKLLADVAPYMGVSGMFFLFTASALACVLTGCFIVPETKGKTLHEVTRMFYNDTQIKRKRLASEGYVVCPDKDEV